MEEVNPKQVRPKKIEYFLTDRDLDSYKEFLDLDLDDMRGRAVLDIGSGERESFSKQAADMGVKVISLNPSLKNQASRSILQLDKSWTKRSVAGKAQEMPFGSDIFDYELALYSLPFYLSYSREEYRKFISEIVRTLKPGGKAKIYPVYNADKPLMIEELKKLSEKIDYEFQYVNRKSPEKDMDSYRLVITKKVN